MKPSLATLVYAAALTIAGSLPGISALAQSQQLIVVEDRGGTSALPYYAALGLESSDVPVAPLSAMPAPRAEPASEADMLPVRSRQLTPGNVQPQAIRAPGLTPMILVGDDPRSRAWLRERASDLRDLNAVGLVVNVDTADALAALRALAPGITLSPASGDDVAARLGLRHYPVLITATGIEQ